MPSAFAPALERREFTFSAAVREKPSDRALSGHDFKITVYAEVGSQNYELLAARVALFDGTLLVGPNDQLVVTLQGYFDKPPIEVYPDATLKSLAEELGNHLQGGWNTLKLEAGAAAVVVRPQ